MTNLRRAVLQKVVTDHGGQVSDLAGATHVVIGAGVPETTWCKLPVEVCIVQAEWLSKSVQQGRRMPEAEFQVRAALPVPKAAAQTAPAAQTVAAAPAAAEAKPATAVSAETPIPEPLPPKKEEPKTPPKRQVMVRDADVPLNAEISKKLKELAEAYSARGERWRSWQLAKAERLVRTWPEPLRRPEDFERISGLGPKTREKCRELLSTGGLQRLEAIQGDESTHILQDFTCIHGAGESVARRWFMAGCRSLEDLRARQDELQLTRTQRLGLKYVEDFKQRIPRKEAEMLIQTVADAADTAYGKNQVELIPCGSMRRGAQSMSDVDLVLVPCRGCVLPGGLKPLLVELREAGVAKEDLGGHAPNSPYDDGEETHLGVFRLPTEGSLHRRMDLILSRREHLPLVLLNWTGSGLFLRELHRLASYKGFKISSTQLLARDAAGHMVEVPVTEEADVFEALGLVHRPPEQRELDDSLMRFVQSCKPGAPALKRQKTDESSRDCSELQAVQMRTNDLQCLTGKREPRPRRPSVANGGSTQPLSEAKVEELQLAQDLAKSQEEMRRMSRRLSQALGMPAETVQVLAPEVGDALLEDKKAELKQKQDQAAELRAELEQLQPPERTKPPEIATAVSPESVTSDPGGLEDKSPKSPRRRMSLFERRASFEELAKNGHINPELMQQLLHEQGETIQIQQQLASIEDLIKVIRSKGGDITASEKQKIKDMFGKAEIKNVEQLSQAQELKDERKKIKELEQQVVERRSEWSSIEGVSKALKGLAEGNLNHADILKKVRAVNAAHLRTGLAETGSTNNSEMATLQAAAAMARSDPRRRKSEQMLPAGWGPVATDRPASGPSPAGPAGPATQLDSPRRRTSFEDLLGPRRSLLMSPALSGFTSKSGSHIEVDELMTPSPQPRSLKRGPSLNTIEGFPGEVPMQAVVNSRRRHSLTTGMAATRSVMESPRRLAMSGEEQRAPRSLVGTLGLSPRRFSVA
ncbi:unnamed protein product [Effrenium voratum]|nr:unnamed protein product [Effrenium voratum]